MMNTLEDFWRMIWESGSCLIVKLDGTITLNDLKFMDSVSFDSDNVTGAFSQLPIMSFSNE